MGEKEIRLKQKRLELGPLQTLNSLNGQDNASSEHSLEALS